MSGIKNNIKKCRVCYGDLFKNPILVYKNMPKSAQYLPNENELKSDKGINLKICQCSNCGLIQLDNKPVSYYKEVIRASGISNEMVSFRKKQFSKWLSLYNLKNKNIIEIGCGHGEYLKIMKECEANVFGIEYSDEGINDCIKNKLNVKKLYIDSKSVFKTKNKFDAFYILNFLEHMPNPNNVLKNIRKNLKEDGIGLIEVPNFNAISSNNLFLEFIIDHLFYFTKESLSFLLNYNGFEILNIEEIFDNYIISATVKNKLPIDLFIFDEYQFKLKENIKKFFNSKISEKIAIWGAGHQSLTFLSFASKYTDNICFVIDSAPFKQKKYTPVSHIKIVSPLILETMPVDNIIVIAGGYNNSIISKIKSINKNINIYTLDGCEITIQHE